MKYKFEKIDNDTTKLSYKDKEFTIKRDVDLTRKMQGLYAKARTKMMKDLTSEGMTKKDLTIEKKENGKTYYDNTNAMEVERAYIEMASLDLYNEISKSNTGMELQELMEDIGLTEGEAEEFGAGFSNALKGDSKTPSEDK
jgi:hypothetical protein